MRMCTVVTATSPLHLLSPFSLQAKGKVDNYTDLPDIGLYPTKRPPQDKVQYTEVTPSDVTPPDITPSDVSIEYVCLSVCLSVCNNGTHISLLTEDTTHLHLQ